MTINVAGTNAIAGYLVSKIVNTRTLMGLPTQAVTSSLPAATAGATPAASASANRAALQAQLRAQQLANTETLFGISSNTAGSAASLPPIAGETAQQIANVAIQSSFLASRFSTIATLFGFGTVGTNGNTEA